VLKSLSRSHEVAWVEGGDGELSVHVTRRVEVGEGVALAVRDALEGTVRLTMIMIDFASGHTRCGGSTRWTTTTSCVHRSQLDHFRC
jgi:hypothetical protein